jgi:hypothetical protein
MKGFQQTLSAPYNGELLQEGFLTRLEAGGKGIVYSSFYGRSASWEQVRSVAVDQDGSACLGLWVYGVDGSSQWLLSRVRGDGSARVFERRWPASPTQQTMGFPAVVLAPGHRLVLAGDTLAKNLPATNKPNPLTDKFDYLACFNSTNGNYISAVYFAGGNLSMSGVCVDAAGDIVLAGYFVGPEYQAADFPLTDPLPGGPEPGKSFDTYVAKFRSTDLSLSFSTLLGGPANDFPSGLALDPAGNPFLTGYTTGGFPTVNAFQPIYAGESDAFLLKLSFGEKLQTSRSGQALRLSWPASATGFVLESAGSIQGGNWTEVATPPVVEGDQKVVTLEIGPGSQFFRLRGS